MYNTNLIEYIQKKKHELRLRRTFVIMANHKGEYSCLDCIHNLTKSCGDAPITYGCEYWHSGDMDNRKKGLLELYPDLYGNRRQKKTTKFFDTSLFDKRKTLEKPRKIKRVSKNPPALKFEPMPTY